MGSVRKRDFHSTSEHLLQTALASKAGHTAAAADHGGAHTPSHKVAQCSKASSDSQRKPTKGGRARPFLIKQQNQVAAHTLVLTAAAANTHTQGGVKGLSAGVSVCSTHGAQASRPSPITGAGYGYAALRWSGTLSWRKYATHTYA